MTVVCFKESQQQRRLVALQRAIEKGTVQQVKHLLRQCGDACINVAIRDNGGLEPDKVKEFVNDQDNNGNTLLHLAAQHGYSDLIKWLLDKCAGTISANAQNNFGLSPLHMAVIGCHFKITEKLLSVLDADDVNIRDASGEHVLHKAARNDDGSIFELLLGVNGIVLNASDDSGRNCFHHAAVNGNIKALQKLFSNGIDNKKIRDNDGKTCLHLAAQADGPDVISFLLKNDSEIDVNAADINGNTPLHLAAKSGNHNAAKALLASGRVQIKCRNNDGFTALVRANTESVFQIILEATGDDFFARDNSDCTVLHHAAMENELFQVTLLEKKVGITLIGEHINDTDQEGRTPLHIAAAEGRSEIVEYFLDTELINVNATKRNGNTPLHEAVLGGHIAVIKLLLSAKDIDVNAKNNDGSTPLHLAVECDHFDVVKELTMKPEKKNVLQRKYVDVNITDSDNKTPLHLANECGHVEIEKLLEGLSDIGKKSQ